MIVDFILGFIYSVVTTLLSPITNLANVSLSADVSNSFTQMRGLLHAIDFVLPYLTLLAVIAAVVVAEGIILSFKVINWLLKRLPTQS